MYIAGTTGIVVFYSTILGITIWSVFTKRKKLNSKSLDYLILGNRNIGLILGISTLVATWSGRVFIYGTVETIFSKNLTWCQVPIGYSFSLIFGAILFIKPIRNDKKFLTILDPFQQKYGPRLGSLLFISTLFSDLFWCASIIKALSNTISLIFKIDSNISISIGLIVVITYTILIGGIYKTSIADVVQVIFLIVGLGIATPYVILNPAVVSLEKNFIKNNNDWLDEVAVKDLADWIDRLLLLTFGGLSCQSYFQQMISIKSTSNAKIISIVSMLICLTLTLPSILIGLAAREINWSLIDNDDDDNDNSNINKTSLSVINSDDTNNGSIILPIILKYLTPQWVGFISLGAITASVISSSTSSILSSSFIFVRNIYKIIIRPKASDNELLWILRITIVLITFMSGGIIFSIDGNASVYYLSYLASDFTYVLLFPQLLGVIYWPSLIDTYGYLAGYFISIIMRIAGGEKKLGLWPPLINYPFFDNQTRNQKFPFRTLIVISSIIIQLLVSFITKSIFTQHNTGDGNHKRTYCPKCCDFLGIYSLSGKKGSKKQSSVAQSSSGAALILDDSAITQEGSLRDGCDSTDSQEELTATLVDNNYHHQYNQNNNHHHHHHQQQQQQLHQDSSLISKKINFNNFNGEHTLCRGMSVQNTPVTRVDRSAFSKNSTQTPGRNNININNNNHLDSEQILAVRNLIPVSCYLKTTNESPNNINLLNHSNNNNNNNNTATVPSTPSFSNQSHNNLTTNSSNVIYGKLESIKITKNRENKASGVISGDRSFLELNLNHNLNNLKEGKVESGSGVGVSVSSSSSSSSSSSLLSTGIVKKNVVGVKLVGMDGMTMTTLRRPSQSTFSPTPSVELVNILDNKKQCGTTGESSVSGPISLLPIPTSTLGVEACKIHGTSVDGSGNDHCRIKRGIVRHHSFNETGDRTLTTLARQPAYPSMPLRTEDCRMTVLMTNKKDRKTSASHIVRYSSVSDEKEHSNRFITSSTGVTGVGSRRGLVISPTYGIYGSTITPTDINYSTTFTYNNTNINNDNNDDYHDDQDNNEAISKF